MKNYNNNDLKIKLCKKILKKNNAELFIKKNKEDTEFFILFTKIN